MATVTNLFCHLCQEAFDKKEDISVHNCVEIKQETLDFKAQTDQNPAVFDSNLPHPPAHLTGLP